MSNARAVEMMRKMTQEGGAIDFSTRQSRLVVGIVRALAEGCPISQGRLNEIASAATIEGEEANRVLRQMERDAEDNIVGAMGLSLNDHPHRFAVNGVRMSAWCAGDTLFLPAVLNRTATVESDSPISGETVRLTVGPKGVEEASPAGAALSIVILDPDKVDRSSVEAIWSQFCHHILFFTSQAEAEQWAAGRSDIEILSLEEGFEVVRLVAERLLAHE